MPVFSLKIRSQSLFQLTWKTLVIVGFFTILTISSGATYAQDGQPAFDREPGAQTPNLATETQPLLSDRAVAPSPLPDGGIDRSEDEIEARMRQAASELREKSDLEAQWVSANAANRAADSAELGIWLSIISLILSTVGAVVIIYILKLSRIATKSAIEANKISGDIAENQLRAYIHVSNIEIQTFADGPGLDIILTIKNYGNTPSDHISVNIVLSPENENMPIATKYFVLAPSQDIEIRFSYVMNYIINALWIHKDENLSNIFIIGKIKYTDCYKKKRDTDFKYEITKVFYTDGNGQKAKKLVASMCESGNRST